eukprot:926976-Pelagomonas_calceolata.AAC.1
MPAAYECRGCLQHEHRGVINTTREKKPAAYECKGCPSRDACGMNMGESSTQSERGCLQRVNISLCGFRSQLTEAACFRSKCLPTRSNKLPSSSPNPELSVQRSQLSRNTAILACHGQFEALGHDFWCCMLPGHLVAM